MKVVCCVANDDNLSMGHSKIAGFFCHDSVFFFYFVVIPKFHSSFNQYMCFYYVQNIVSM